MRAIALTLPLALVCTAHAQTVDRARLQKAAALPTVSISTEFGISPSRPLDLPDGADLRPEADRLRRELKTAPTDVNRWRRLGLVLNEQGERESAALAYNTAIDLLEKQQAKFPADGVILAKLGDSYRQVGRVAEAEATLSAAVKRAPKEWAAWVALGGLQESKAWKRLSLTDAEVSALLKLTPLERTVKIQTTYQQRLTPSALAEANRLLSQAQKSYDRAVKAAPAEPEPYFYRATSRMLQEGGLIGLIATLTSNASTGASALRKMMAPEVVADLRKARRLAADAPETITASAAMEFVWTMIDQQAAMDDLGSEAGWKKLSPSAQSSVIEASLRLTELSISPNKSISAAALEGAGLLAYFRGQREKMESFLLRASNLRPLNGRSFNLLTLAYIQGERYDALAELYRKRIETDDTGRYRFLLAKFLLKQGQTEAAVLQLKSGLEKEPGNFACSAGLAAIRLQAGDTQNPMGFLAPFSKSVVDESLGAEDRAVWFLLSAIQQGLTGQPDRAKQLLDAGEKLDPSNPAFAEARAALGN